MAIRANIFENDYRFNEALGPKGSHYAMGEETELNMRLAKAGFKAWHCKSAIVHHMIRSSQMTQDWVLNRAIPYGRAQYRRERRECPNSPTFVLKARCSLPPRILAQRLRVGWARWSGNAEKTFKGRWQLNFLIGRAVEAGLKGPVN
jgi:GT2 family glycosyltransferase